MQLRALLQKQTKLITQMDALHPSKRPDVNNVNTDVPPTEGDQDDEYPAPADDDAVGQALFAVYNKGLRKGKGKSKTRPSTDQSGKAASKGKGRCLNCGKTGHRTDECKLAKVPSWERPCFDCGKPGHQAANCPNKKGQAVNNLNGDLPRILMLGYSRARRQALNHRKRLLPTGLLRSPTSSSARL